MQLRPEALPLAVNMATAGEVAEILPSMPVSGKVSALERLLAILHDNPGTTHTSKTQVKHRASRRPAIYSMQYAPQFGDVCYPPHLFCRCLKVVFQLACG